MRYCRFIFACLLILPLISSFYTSVYAEADDAGIPGSFLNFGAGARSLAMGGAFVARADDVSTIYWNPAGLSQLPRKEATFFFANLWEDTSYVFSAYAHPTERLGTFGIGLIGLNSEGFERRDTVYDDPTEFKVDQNAFLLSYGRTLWRSLAMGANIKFCSKNIMGYKDSAAGVDVGLLYQIPFVQNLSLGINIQNAFSPSLKVKSTEERFAISVKTGLGYRLFSLIKHWEDSLNLELDVDKTEHRKARVRPGIEYWYLNKLALRIGFRDDNPTFGLGFASGNFEVDWALAPHELGVSHRFSVTMRFGKWLREEKVEYRKWQAKRRAREYYLLGDRYYKRGELADALVEWEKAIILDPDNEALEKEIEEVREKLEVIVNRKIIEKHISEAYTHYQDGKLVESLQEWKEVARLDPGNQRAREYIERINDKLSKKEKDEYQKKAEEKQRAKVSQYMVRGDRYYDREEYSQAIAEWKKALKLNPEHRAAKENIDQAKKRVQELVKSHYKQGVDFHTKKQSLKAIAEFRRVLKLESGNKGAKEYLARAKKQAAEEKKAVDKKEVERLYYQAADLYLKGDYDQALNVLNKIMELDPANEHAEKLMEKTKSVMEVLQP